MYCIFKRFSGKFDENNYFKVIIYRSLNGTLSYTTYGYKKMCSSLDKILGYLINWEYRSPNDQ